MVTGWAIQRPSSEPCGTTGSQHIVDHSATVLLPPVQISRQRRKWQVSCRSTGQQQGTNTDHSHASSTHSQRTPQLNPAAIHQWQNQWHLPTDAGQQCPSPSPSGQQGIADQQPSPDSHKQDVKSSINKDFVKSLRGVTSLQRIKAALDQHATTGSDLDVQSITAVGSALARLSRHCSSGQQLQLQHPHQLSQAASTAHELQSRREPGTGQSLGGLQQFAAQVWLPLLMSCVDSLDAVGLYMCLQAVCQLQLFSSPVLEPLMLACIPHMPHSSPRVLAGMLWSVAQLDLPPPKPWLNRWARASAACLHAFSLQDMANSTWAMAKLGWVPPDSWTRQLLDTLVQHNADSHRQVSTTRDHSHVATHSAVHEEQGPRQPTEASAASSVSTSDAASADEQLSRLRSLSVVMWSLAQLKVLPPPDVLDHSMQAASNYIKSLPVDRVTHPATSSSVIKCLAMLSHSLIRWQYQPSQHFLHTYLHATQACLPAATPRELVVIGMATNNWQLWPSPDWMASFTRSSAACLSDCNAQALVILMDVLVQHGYHPPTAWLQQHEVQVRQRIGSITPVAAARLLSCWAVLKYQPHPLLGNWLWQHVLQHAAEVPAKRWFPAVLAATLLAYIRPEAAVASGVPAAGGLQHKALSRNGGVAADQNTGSALHVWAVSQDKLAHCHAINLCHAVWSWVVLASTAPARNAGSSTTGAGQVQTASGRAAQRHGAEGGVMGGLAEVRPVRLASQQASWQLPASFLPSIMAAARQQLNLAPPSDLTSLMHGLATLTTLSGQAHNRHDVDDGGDGNASIRESNGFISWSAGPGPGHSYVDKQQLSMLLAACVSNLGSYTCEQLVCVLEASWALGGRCNGGASVSGVESDVRNTGSSEEHSHHAGGQSLHRIGKRAVQLMLEQQQQVLAQQQIGETGLEPTGPTWSEVGPVQDGYAVGKRAGRLGLRGWLLSHAVQAAGEAETIGSQYLPSVLRLWKVLDGVGFLQDQSSIRRHRLCTALGVAVEQEAMMAGSRWYCDPRNRVLAYSLAQSSGWPPHQGWLADVPDLNSPHPISVQPEPEPALVI